MNAERRSKLAALLAVLGALGIYSGSLLNAVALGGTLGYVTIILGIVCLGLSPIPVLRSGTSTEYLLLARICRYLCLPLFLLSAFFAAGALLDPTPTYGLASGVALTVAGLASITWPEVCRLWKRKHGEPRDAA